ncbi:site-specific DNA-methyltransferase [Salmonella enterica]|nr:site-specific DNA-methyltransferase [Salmonella enterica]EDN2676090.1 site-specific DNA-methyltransferase [Salmonella enterica]EEN5461783.1 site-specific DNA-methyltransferase [Salmonella enterica]
MNPKDIPQLHHGDCLDIMPTLEPGSVDLIVCDPPYGTMKGMSTHSWSADTTHWDNAIKPEVMFAVCEHVLRVNGVLVLFSQEPYTSRLITQAHSNLPFSYRMVWKKEHFGNPLIARSAPVSYFEDILVFFKKYETNPGHLLREYSRRVRAFTGATAAQVERVLGHGGANHFWRADSVQFSLPTRSTYDQLTAAYNLSAMPGFMTYDEMKHSEMALPGRVFRLPPGKKHKSNILEYARDREKYHPTQKPVALLEDLIQTYSNPGDTVLDFTMGSGSTGVACIRAGRRFIGIEKEQKYFDIAADRIARAEGREVAA